MTEQPIFRDHLHRRVRHAALPLTLLLTSATALAHEGHGLPGVNHWHAIDAGSIAVVAMFFVGLWLLGKK
ncbi:MAG: hypothetical protein RLZZ584_1301 [Pseudomonadota bacterium]|jgi:hypothetical protein